MRKLTLQYIQFWLEENKPEFELCEGSIYKGSHEKGLIIFHNIPECGEIFNARWGDILHGGGCSVCAGRQVGERTSLTYLRPDLAIEWHPDNEKTSDQVVCGSHDRVYWICSTCGYGKGGEWFVEIVGRTNMNSGCPACSGNVVTDLNRLSIRFPYIAEEWDYEKNTDTPDDISYGKNDKRWWVCPEGHSYFSIVNDRTNKNSGCIVCSLSKGEEKIRKFLDANDVFYKPQKPFDNCVDKIKLRFDFGIPYDNDFWKCIEYHGEQHFFPVDFAGKGEKWAKQQLKETKKRDKIKRDYCEENNIPLLIIPYWDFDRIEEILSETLL